MLIKSAILTSASGSVGGLTASHNAGGLYFRARTIPVNPNSAPQQQVRNAMTVLTSAWVTDLTAGQRDGWKTYGVNVGLVNPLGDQIEVSGISMYVRSNVARLQAGLDRVDDAPTVFNLGSFTEPTITAVSAATQTLSLDFDDTDDWANEDGAAMLVYISRPQNLTINFFKGPYRLATSILGDGTTAPTSPAAIDLPFTAALGQKVFLRARVTRGDGRLSGEFRAGSPVTA